MVNLTNITLPEKIDYPEIVPVSAGEARPLFAVMITTYNCAEFLEKTLASVLAADLGPQLMQIEVVDDCSTKDDPEEVVRRLGKGRVQFYRQPRNVGISANFTTGVIRARGRYVQILNGDDLVMPCFYAAYQSFFNDNPDVVGVFNRPIAVDEEDNWVTILQMMPGHMRTGIVPDALFEIVKENYITTSNAMFARWAYERVGGFCPFLTHSADWEMWMRLTSCGPLGYIHEPLSLYRMRSNSSTVSFMYSSKGAYDALRANRLGLRLLPPELRTEAKRGGYRACACMVRNYGRHLHNLGQHAAALRNSLLALRLSPSPLNLFFVCRSLLYCMRLKSLFT